MANRGRIVGELSRFGLSSINQNFYTKQEVDEKLSQKSSVSVSNEGTATDEISYITIDGVEKKIKSDISTSTLDKNLGDYKTELIYDSGTFIASTSSENNSDPFADTPSTSLKGLVLACINDQGVVDNTITDEFAQTYFVSNCVIKVMGKGAFYFD